MPFADPTFQKLRRRRLQVDPSVRAVPTTTDIDVGQATQKARRGLRARRDVATHRLGTQRLEERIRSGRAKETFAQEKFDIAKKQSRIAELIDLGSLGLEGLSGLNIIQEADRQTKAIDALIAEAEAQGDFMAAFRAKQVKIFKGLG